MNQIDYDYVFKILLIGNIGVGKSSLLMRFVHDIFNDHFVVTLAVDFKVRTLESEGKVAKLQLCDPSGQERFQSIVSSFYKGVSGIILVYDITNRKSFEDIRDWMVESEKKTTEDVVRLLVGNKKDLELEREVS